MTHGGKRKGAGRKSKASEVNLIEKLSPLEDAAYLALKDGVEKGDFKFVQLFYHYFAGKPKETQDIHLQQDSPIFEVKVLDNDAKS